MQCLDVSKNTTYGVSSMLATVLGTLPEPSWNFVGFFTPYAAARMP